MKSKISIKFVRPEVGMLWTIGNLPGVNRINTITEGTIYYDTLGDTLGYNTWIVNIHEWQKLIDTGVYKLVDAEFIESEIVGELIEWEVGLSINYPHFIGLMNVRVFAEAGALQDEITNKAKAQLIKDAYPVTYKRIS